jgi:Lon protease-like protein
MARSPFIPTYDALPQTLPIFPLPGAIVMPNSELPLNIFEPRYLNMVEDALASHRLIGMIQPALEPDSPKQALSPSGCAGRITQYRETLDGRIEIVLTGVCRFDAGEEIRSTRGYRLVVPRWQRFAADCDESHESGLRQRGALDASLKRYFEVHNLQADWERLARLPAQRMLNSLISALPIGNGEKQALLETVDDEARAELFIGLLQHSSSGQQNETRH